MAEWPSGLPSYVLVDGYTEIMPNNTIFSNPDIGPPKARRRSTAAIAPVKVQILLNTSQVATLISFYRSTLSEGTLPFTWTHPRTTGSITARFMSPPIITAVSGTHYNAILDLGVMP